MASRRTKILSDGEDITACFRNIFHEGKHLFSRLAETDHESGLRPQTKLL